MFGTNDPAANGTIQNDNKKLDENSNTQSVSPNPDTIFPSSVQSEDSDPFGTAPSVVDDTQQVVPSSTEPITQQMTATPPKVEPPKPVVTPRPAVEQVDPSILASMNGTTDDLASLKKDVLESLSPLVEELDQEPNEKFKTTMMMIQSTDNKSLIASAYKIAQDIASDKERAQALLDIVHEIDYFSQQSSSSQTT